jgi:asparagine synthase (glutamine-hydrolysing)
MKHFSPEQLQHESAHTLRNLHNINLQRTDRMGMLFSLELRVPFLDLAMLDVAAKISPDLKIREHNGKLVEKWILRKAFEGTGYLPEEILWRYKVQYTQGAGCESVGVTLAEQHITDDDYERIRTEAPQANINSKEAAYYYQIFRTYYPQDSALRTVGIWNGFNFPEEREPIKGTVK